MFSKTQFGVLLLGNVEQMLLVLDKLPFNNEKFDIYYSTNNLSVTSLAINCLGF